MKYSDEQKEQFFIELFDLAKKNEHGIHKVANVTGVSPAYLSKIKNGHRKMPSDKIIDKLKKYTSGNYEETELKTKKKDEYMKGYERGYKDAMKKMKILDEDFNNITKKIRSIRGEING